MIINNLGADLKAFGTVVDPVSFLGAGSHDDESPGLVKWCGCGLNC